MKTIPELAKQAIDYAAEQYGPQRAGEQVWDPHTYDKKFAELVIDRCCAILLEMDEKTNGNHNYYKHAALEIKRRMKQ